MKEPTVIMLGKIDPAIRQVFWEHVPPGFNVVWMEADQAGPQEVIEQMRDADFLLLMRSGVTEAALRAARQLKLIQLFGQGYDHVPIGVTSELGIPVANAGGANARAVAEHTVMLLLSAMRSLYRCILATKEGQSAIDIDRRLFHQLYGKTVGIIGLGTIGREVAKLLLGFDVNVIFHNRSPVAESALDQLKARPVAFEELLRTSDIVSLHVPLLESTRHLIGERELGMMKPSAVLINTSRGAVVDEQALIRALREKRLAGAGLDVFSKEPPDRDNPLLSMDNVVVTPHIGGYSWETFLTRFDVVWGNIIGVWEGKPPRNVVGER